MKRIIGCIAALLCATTASAQDFPNKPIRVAIGFGPGGPTDVIARVTADAMTRAVGQPVIVENRPGAGGIVAADYVATQQADGYTLMFTGLNFTYFPIFNAAWKLDILKSFTYLGTVTDGSPTLIISSAQIPARNLRELIDYGKQNPGKLNYGRIGTGPWDMAILYLSKAHGWNLSVVPYKSSADARAAAQRGDIHIWVDGAVGAAPEVAQGRARLMAVLGPERVPGVDAPTLTEAGVSNPRFEPTAWFGFLGPANMAPNVVNTLVKGVSDAARNQEFGDKIKLATAPAKFRTPAEQRALVAKDFEIFSKVAKEVGIKPE